MKIKNVTNERQAVAWIPAFAAGEVKDVNKSEADVLLKNESFQLVKEEKKEKEPKQTEPVAEPATEKKK